MVEKVKQLETVVQALTQKVLSLEKDLEEVKMTRKTSEVVEDNKTEQLKDKDDIFKENKVEPQKDKTDIIFQV